MRAGVLAVKRQEVTAILDRFRSAVELAAVALESEPEEAALHLLLAIDRHIRALRRIAESHP